VITVWKFLKVVRAFGRQKQWGASQYVAEEKNAKNGMLVCPTIRKQGCQIDYFNTQKSQFVNILEGL
jgi:hypothetical protein